MLPQKDYPIQDKYCTLSIRLAGCGRCRTLYLVLEDTIEKDKGDD